MRFSKTVALWVLVFPRLVWGIDCAVKAERQVADWSPQALSDARYGTFNPLVMNLTDWFSGSKTSLTLESNDSRCEAAAKVLGTAQWDGVMLLEFAFPDFAFQHEDRGIERFTAPAPVGTLVVEYRETEGHAYRLLKTQRLPLALKCDGAFTGGRQQIEERLLREMFGPAVYQMKNYPRHCTFRAQTVAFEPPEGEKFAISFSGAVTKKDKELFSLRFDRLEVK